MVGPVIKKGCLFVRNLLVVGPIDAAAQTLLAQLAQQAAMRVTVYTPSRVTVPAGMVGLTQETLDEGGLTAAMVGQDAAVALVPTIQLAATTRQLATAARAVGLPRLIVSRTDDMDELAGDQRLARRQLQDAGVAYDFVDGIASVPVMLGIAPTPLVVAPFIAPSKKSV